MIGLEILSQNLGQSERKRISQRLGNSPVLLAMWQGLQKPAKTKPASNSSLRENQDRHRLGDVVLDTLVEIDLEDNTSLKVLRELSRFEVLLSRNQLLDALRLLLRLKRSAVKQQDRLYMPEILMKEAYLCRLLDHADRHAVIEEELNYWWAVRQLDQEISLLAMTKKDAYQPASLQPRLASLGDRLEGAWPIALKQDGFVVLAKLYFQIGDEGTSYYYFDKAQGEQTLQPQTGSEAIIQGKALRQQCLIWAEWLLYFPRPDLAYAINDRLPKEPDAEPRAEVLRQWVLLILGWCLAEPINKERYMVLHHLLPQAR